MLFGSHARSAGGWPCLLAYANRRGSRLPLPAPSIGRTRSQTGPNNPSAMASSLVRTKARSCRQSRHRQAISSGRSSGSAYSISERGSPPTSDTPRVSCGSTAMSIRWSMSVCTMPWSATMTISVPLGALRFRSASWASICSNAATQCSESHP